MENKNDYEIFSKEIIDALKKYIKAYQTKETSFEYVADEDGMLKISKKKVNKKVMPPNSDILKILLQLTNSNNENFSNLTDEQLEIEKKRLIKILSEETKDES